MSHPQSRARGPARHFGVGMIGFLTLVDLFAAQAILPTLAAAYRVSPSAMGVAVNASTLGMAAAGLGVALFGGRLPRRGGIWCCLALLAIPTSLLAFAPDLATFTVLRIVQGVFMASAFSLTMAYLSEDAGEDTASALAAYVTGGVASNLFGRLASAWAVSTFGLSANFHLFAALNIAGGLLVFLTLKRTAPPALKASEPSALARVGAHLRNTCLNASFGIGFCVLFAFIGAFTYVNFVLARPPLALSPMSLGLVYFVFLPSLITTPMAGRVAQRYGPRQTFWLSLGLAGVGLPLLLASAVAAVVAGLVLVGVGTFFAQATATGFVGRAAKTDRASASGLYLASYYLGGLAGATVVGQIFDRFGWPAAVGAVGVSLALAAYLAALLRPATAGAPMRTAPARA